MDDVHRLEAKGLARAKVRSKRRRVQTIRRRTIRGSLALFAISWAIVFGQLVTGNDPALSRSSQSAPRKLLASTHRARPAQVPDDESAPVSTPPPVASSPTPTPAPVVSTPAPSPAPVYVPPPPPPPAPVVTSAS